jgi:hypothetical protein
MIALYGFGRMEGRGETKYLWAQLAAFNLALYNIPK